MFRHVNRLLSGVILLLLCTVLTGCRGLQAPADSLLPTNNSSPAPSPSATVPPPSSGTPVTPPTSGGGTPTGGVTPPPPPVPPTPQPNLPAIGEIEVQFERLRQPVSQSGYEPILADFNGDGRMDLAFASHNAVQVWHGSGDGKFSQAATYSFSSWIATLISADIDADGRVDIVGGSNATIIAFLRNTGSGFVQSELVTAHPTHTLAGGDLFGDGSYHLAVSDQQLGVSVFRNDGRGNFSATGSLPPFTYRVTAIAVGDLDADGKADLAVTECCTGGSRSFGYLHVLWGEGNGKFKSGLRRAGGHPRLLKTQEHSGRVYLHYLNGSVGSIPGSSVDILLFNPDRTFRDGGVYENSLFGSLWTIGALHDFNGDGLLDYVAYIRAGGYKHVIGSQNRIKVYLADADLRFWGKTIEGFAYSEEESSRGVYGDLNGDGTLDVAAITTWSADPHIETFLNLGPAKNYCPQPLEGSTVTICWPQLVSGNPVKVLASAKGSNSQLYYYGTIAMQIYVDGELRADVVGTPWGHDVFLNRSVTVTPGAHTIKVVGWTNQKQSYSSEVKITVP